MLIVAVAVNCLVIVIFYYALGIFEETPQLLPMMHSTLLWLSVSFLFIVLISFSLAVILDPGYIKKKIDFI
jgi:hypothetical protein